MRDPNRERERPPYEALRDLGLTGTSRGRQWLPPHQAALSPAPAPAPALPPLDLGASPETTPRLSMSPGDLLALTAVEGHPGYHAAGKVLRHLGLSFRGATSMMRYVPERHRALLRPALGLRLQVVDQVGLAFMVLRCASAPARALHAWARAATSASEDGESEQVRTLAESRFPGAFERRDRNATTAHAAMGRYREAAEATKAALRKFRDGGVPPLTVDQGRLVLEVLKCACVLTEVCGAEERMAAQFVEAITDTTGFLTIAASDRAAEAAPSALDWTQEPPPHERAAVQFDLAMTLVAARGDLGFSVVAAGICVNDAQHSAAVATALSA